VGFRKNEWSVIFNDVYNRKIIATAVCSPRIDLAIIPDLE
jgi:hypothetical protein